MRFKITLKVNENAYGRKLPLNYQYELSAAVYRIFASSDKEFATWLHENGFHAENGYIFKLFTFSRLFPQKLRLLGQSNQMELLSDQVEWQIGFLPEKSTQQFIEGLFQNRIIEVGNRQSTVQFEVGNIELLPALEYYESMTFHALSPISVSQKDALGRDCYPKDGEEFETAPWIRERLLQNLINKYEAFYGCTYEGERRLDFEALTDPKSVLVTIKADTPQETKVRGFMCKITLRCPEELMRIAYECGLGEANGQGFGCLGRKGWKKDRNLWNK